MICSVRITLQEDSSGFLIPNSALQHDIDGNQFVYVINENTVMKKIVAPISLIDTYVLVSADLNSENDIVTSGQNRLQSGDAVNIIQ